MTRQEVFSWCKQQYGTEPEYPWNDWNVVLRHTDNQKWYGLIMEVGRNKLGYAILVREEFSCLEFIMNRDTINWILKKLNTGGRTWSIYQRKSIKTASATRWWENTTSPT